MAFRRFRYIVLILWATALAMGVRSFAQRASAPAQSFPAYKLYAGTEDKDGWPTCGARLCVVDSDRCFALISKTSGQVRYDLWKGFVEGFDVRAEARTYLNANATAKAPWSRAATTSWGVGRFACFCF